MTRWDEILNKLGQGENEGLPADWLAKLTRQRKGALGSTTGVPESGNSDPSAADRAAYEADAEREHQYGQPEASGFARDVPLDQSKSAKLARAIEMLRGVVYGRDPEQQGTEEGLHDYQRTPAPKVYPKGKLGSVAKGIESVTDVLQNLMGDRPGAATARDYDLVREGDQPNRGAGAIMGNIARIGARRRVGEEELTHAREDRSVNLDYKRAQSENLRSLGTWRQDRLGLEAVRAETGRITALFQKAKSEADITKGISDGESNVRKADAAVVTAETKVRDSTTREEHEANLQAREEAKAAAKSAKDALDYGLSLRNTIVSERRENREASGSAGLNDLRSAQAAQARANAGKAGSFSQGLIDKATAAKLQKDIDNILKMNKLMLLTDEDAQRRLRQLGVDVPVNEPGFWEKVKSSTETWDSTDAETDEGTDKDNPDFTDSESWPVVPPTPIIPPVAKSSKAGNVTLIGPDGKEYVFDAAKAQKILGDPSIKGWRRK